MIDLSTRYMGFELPHPFMPGASPLVDDLDLVRRLEDAGASCIVMHSLFEEQLLGEELSTHHYMETIGESFAEATSYLPRPPNFALGPEEYLEQIRRIREAVDVPVIASLNGTSPRGWLRYARLMQDAGAQGLELNFFELATDFEESGKSIEERSLEMVRMILGQVKMPVSLKLSPYYTSLAHYACQLSTVGVQGLVLFNRFYQSDIDVESLEVAPTLRLSQSSELLLRLRWLAILSGRVPCSLAASGGIHTALDAVKAIMSGAHAVQVVSALLKEGPEHLRTLREEVVRWMEEHEYESLQQMQGSMNLLRCPDPKSFSRTNYMRILQSWQGFV